MFGNIVSLGFGVTNQNTLYISEQSGRVYHTSIAPYVNRYRHKMNYVAS